jgi:hypothetical protein
MEYLGVVFLVFRMIVIYPGEIWGGADVLGKKIAGRGPPTAGLGYASEVQGGFWSGWILVLEVGIVQHPTRRGEPSTDRRPGPYSGCDQNGA